VEEGAKTFIFEVDKSGAIPGAKVGLFKLTVSIPLLKSPMISTLDIIMQVDSINTCVESACGFSA
jgi:hypothetical protein